MTNASNSASNDEQHPHEMNNNDTHDPRTNATDNVDWQEVNKFESLAERWWDPTSEFRPLHEINPLRLDYIIRRVGGDISGQKVIDVGCGGGILAESLATKGAIVDGIDAGEANIQVATIHAEKTQSSVNYHQTTAEAFAQSHAEQYDVVCCMEMLEHVPDPSKVIQACAQLVKPDGFVFFSTINRTPKAYLFAIVGAEYVLKLLPKGTHEYDKFLRPDEIDQTAITAGLTLKDAIGMHYNPITKNYWLASGLDVNYITAYQKRT